ncbi:hypothetical protein [Flavihumibacter sp. CACIAM 22H1]|uniref:hypothetical protein n=1 Tax=Flavihumibacter sp. CACIAM 22H1 TaxID=1812911 RepID=UPI0007A86823|nr:hypothetical protein [Flavihumibacter sp. CACIAM 22H1]KYP16312.1 MAG: hypothetical protein A1D16_20475 [Flavihumibacter sp. CACIAM 22H1]
MKLGIGLLALIALLFTVASCTRRVVVVHHHPRKQHKVHRLPPGQAKKLHGTRSARPYAPGQRKKRP